MSSRGSETLRILLIDDSPSHAALMAGALTSHDETLFSLERCTRLTDGLLHLQRSVFDLVVLGLTLPDGGGLEGLRAVRQCAPAAPVLILADRADRELAIEAVRRGADDFLVAKTINPAMLTRVIRHAVERARYEAALAASVAKHESLLASIQSPVLALDESMRVIYCNEAYGRFVGLSSSELEGQVLTTLFPAFTRTASCAAYRAAFDTGHNQEVEGPRGDRYLRARVFRAPFGIVAITEDITAYKRAEETLRVRTLELEARNEELDAFNHTVAHDLRNPLGAIRGFVEQLADHVDSMPVDEIRTYLESILHASSKMNSIIEELLLLAGIRRAAEIPVAQLDMPKIVREALLRLSHLTSHYGAEVTIAGALPPSLGHGPWIEEVWVNYLSNALIHGGRPPRITIEGVEHGDHVRYSLRDNGKGIRPEEHPALFSPFTRLGDGKAPGHGLGLSIVRRIVERLNGSVGAASTPDGCTFWFTLPRSGGPCDGA